MLPHSDTPQGRRHALIAVVLALGIVSCIGNVTYGRNASYIPFSAQWWQARKTMVAPPTVVSGTKVTPGYRVGVPVATPPGYVPQRGVVPAPDTGTPGYVPYAPSNNLPGYANLASVSAGAGSCQASVSCSTNQWWICSEPVSSLSQLRDGDLIKGSYEAVYFFAKNGKRYVFPTLKTYLTWYGSNGTCPVIRSVSDSVLAQIQIGGNVTYHSGVRALKITTDPKIYLPVGFGTLKLLPPSAAATLWGPNWMSYVDDLPDAFFVNYQMGSIIPTNETKANLENYKTIDLTVDAQLGL